MSGKDSLEMERLKRGLVLLHAHHTKTLVRCSGLESQIKDREQKLLAAKEALVSSNSRVEELQKHVTELETVLKQINGEVCQFNKDDDSAKPRWRIGKKIAALFEGLKFKKQADSENNLLTLLVGDGSERPQHDPSTATSPNEPALLDADPEPKENS